MDKTLTLIAQLGAGVASLYMVLRILQLPIFSRKNGNGKHETSGDKDPAYWEGVFRRVVREAISDEFKDRNETLRRLIREESRSLLESFERLLRQ